MDIKNGFDGRRCLPDLTSTQRNKNCQKRVDLHTSLETRRNILNLLGIQVVDFNVWDVQSFQFGSRVTPELIELLILKSHFLCRFTIRRCHVSVCKPFPHGNSLPALILVVDNCFLSRHVIRLNGGTFSWYLRLFGSTVRRHKRPMKTKMCKQKRFTFVSLFVVFPKIFLLTENAIFRTFPHKHTQLFLSRALSRYEDDEKSSGIWRQ